MAGLGVAHSLGLLGGLLGGLLKHGEEASRVLILGGLLGGLGPLVRGAMHTSADSADGGGAAAGGGAARARLRAGLRDEDAGAAEGLLAEGLAGRAQEFPRAGNPLEDVLEIPSAKS
eukprot:gene8260-biopygen12727